MAIRLLRLAVAVAAFGVLFGCGSGAPEGDNSKAANQIDTTAKPVGPPPHTAIAGKGGQAAAPQ